MGRYSKIDKRIQNDSKFRALSERAKLVFFLTISHPNMTMIGGMRATVNGLAAEWSMPLESLREAFLEVSEKGIVRADDSACFVWMPNFLKYNRPESPNVVKSWPDALEMLPECAMKSQLFQTLKSFVGEMSEAFAKAFMEAFPKGMPNQEQEQKQEQKQEQGGETPAAEPAEPIPPDLHQLQYAATLLGDLGLPEKGNLEMVGSAIVSYAKSQQISKGQSFEHIRRRALADQAEGIPITTFWFKDARYGVNAHGKQNRKQSPGADIVSRVEEAKRIARNMDHRATDAAG